MLERRDCLVCLSFELMELRKREEIFADSSGLVLVENPNANNRYCFITWLKICERFSIQLKRWHKTETYIYLNLSTHPSD